MIISRTHNHNGGGCYLQHVPKHSTDFPLSSVWTACDTTTWLENYLAKNAEVFTADQLSKTGGFLTAFASRHGFATICAFQQACQGVPSWPPAYIANGDAVQATIVVIAMGYVKDWYNSARSIRVLPLSIRQAILMSSLSTVGGREGGMRRSLARMMAMVAVFVFRGMASSMGKSSIVIACISFRLIPCCRDVVKEGHGVCNKA